MGDRLYVGSALWNCWKFSAVISVHYKKTSQQQAQRRHCILLSHVTITKTRKCNLTTQLEQDLVQECNQIEIKVKPTLTLVKNITECKNNALHYQLFNHAPLTGGIAVHSSLANCHRYLNIFDVIDCRCTIRHP